MVNVMILQFLLFIAIIICLYLAINNITKYVYIYNYQKKLFKMTQNPNTKKLWVEAKPYFNEYLNLQREYVQELRKLSNHNN